MTTRVSKKRNLMVEKDDPKDAILEPVITVEEHKTLFPDNSDCANSSACMGSVQLEDENRRLGKVMKVGDSVKMEAVKSMGIGAVLNDETSEMIEGKIIVVDSQDSSEEGDGYDDEDMIDAQNLTNEWTIHMKNLTETERERLKIAKAEEINSPNV